MEPIYTKDANDKLVDTIGLLNFTHAMIEKLDAKRAEGRGGWHRPDQCSIEKLRSMLIDHVMKGDMVDVGNIAMMIYNRKNCVFEGDHP